VRRQKVQQAGREVADAAATGAALNFAAKQGQPINTPMVAKRGPVRFSVCLS
jgi:hypothetical protein